MKKRELLAGGAGALAIGSTVAANPSAIGGLGMAIAGAVGAVGNGVVNVLNAVAPTATAAINAPVASAVSSMYLANSAMDMVGVENKIAKYLALGGSAVAGFGAGVLGQKLFIGAAIAKGTWDVGKMAWNSNALKNLGKSKSKEA